MASAQVLSNAVGSSRKQGHLEAGKRRLEEFRKKKAAAKKTASTSQSHSVKLNEKQASENGESHINQVSSTADGSSETAKTSAFLNHDDKSVDLQQMEPKQEGNSSDISSLKSEISFVHPRQTDDQVGNVGSIGEGRCADGIPSSNSAINDKIGYYHSKFYGAGESLPNKDVISYETLQNMNAHIKDTAASVYQEGHATGLRRDKSDSVHPTVDLPAFASELGHDQHVDLDLKNNLTSGLKERNTINTAGNFSSSYNHQASEPISGAFNSDVSSSFNGPFYSMGADTHPRKSRTSFIDSLNIGGDSRAPGWSTFEKPASAPVEPPPKPASPPSVNYFGNAYREQKLFGSLENKLEPSSRKQNEEFAALEQHIEDLTQEKFSLQRALDASKSLAESLASENSSLTESYNQQASIVAQLKAEMERVQGEIKARLVELESIKAEYMNVQLECNAADERAKLLASEVIGLEEKALRLRSNELKLERELENSSAEIASYKKKLSSLEKERQDMVQTIDALREEKKLLQSKLRRASASGISVDMNQGHPKKDASTCTNDLGLDVGEADRDNSEQLSSDLQEHDGADNLLSLAMHRPAGAEDAATTFPPDQVQMILNIDSLISEIRAEKEELVKALVTERSTSTKLKDLNKELSQKLEAQTQRVELLTAKSMASENVLARQPMGPRTAQETVAYADEGDEVVERVLGWIIKLFPGGPSKRRTSRL